MSAMLKKESLREMAAKMGQTVSYLADAEPWDPEAVIFYAQKHGDRSEPLGYRHLPDIQIAGAVRMLMRHDLDHESVVCAARDRICALHEEKAALLAALKSAVITMDAAAKATGSIALTHEVGAAREVIAKAEGRAALEQGQ